MIGREQERARLDQFCQGEQFGFLIMYGRRRVGKTTLLQELTATHEAIYYPAQEKNDALNLADFSRLVQIRLGGQYIAPFETWERAMEYVSDAAGTRKVILIIDEFPFIARQNPSIKSILQHTIDHTWKERDIRLILCGSSVSFMLNEVMGYQSPLYGRATQTMEVLPFDYRDSAAFFPGYSQEDQLKAYGILGGVPRYLAAFSPELSLRENVIQRILQNGTFLYDEPEIMLRMELREPGIYGSILASIAGGANKLSEIADRIHEDRSKVGKYLNTLETLRLVTRVTPCGERSERKSIYAIADQYFRFWYRYIYINKGYYEMLGPEAAADEILDNLNDYMGVAFETICRQYLVRAAKARELPFVPATIGKWWGNNPAIRAQDDVDILALSRDGHTALLCECKFTNRPMPMEEYDDLMTAAEAFPEVSDKHYMFISKSGYTSPVVERAQREGVRLLTIADLF